MLKSSKKRIIQTKHRLLKLTEKNKYQVGKFYQLNSNIVFKKRNFFFKNSDQLKNFNVCLISGKKKSINTYLKLNRSVSNSFVRFNYFPNIKAFGK